MGKTMDVRNVSAGLAHREAGRLDPVKAAREVSATELEKTTQSHLTDSPVDRVEISLDAPRETNPEVQDLEFARRALRAAPPMSEARAEEIQRKLSEGYYQSPEIIDAVSNKIRDEM